MVAQRVLLNWKHFGTSFQIDAKEPGVDAATFFTGKSSDLRTVQLPPKLRKRGRPKGAETTVIGLPKAKKVKMGLVPFSKLRAVEKDRVLLECLVRPSVGSKAISSRELVHKESVKHNILDIPD